MGGRWTPRTPDWVAPPAGQVADEHWLAYAMLRTTPGPWAAGVATAIAWIRGGRVGPITDRPEQPVTRALAEAECWAAEAARDPSVPPPLDLIYSQLKVAPYPPAARIDARYCVGCWDALRWVLGRPDRAPPVAVPRRHDDGRVYTADDLYAEATRSRMDRLSPEQRAEIRLRAEVDAIQYQRYDDQITELRRVLSVS
ncbi:MAG: hypothetical protein ACREQ5_36270 [Candidatus Dormibacteria bacterium]